MNIENFEQLKNEINSITGKFASDMEEKVKIVSKMVINDWLRPIRVALEDLTIVQELLAKINIMPVLDPVATSKNKNAQKLRDSLAKLRGMLLEEYTNLQQQLKDALTNFSRDIKDMDAIIEQYSKDTGIKDVAEYKDNARQIRSEYRSNMAPIQQSLRVNKEIFHDGRDIHADANRHYDEQSKIDDIFNEREQQVDEFELSVMRLDNILRSTSKKDEQYKTIVNQAKVIKKEITPRVVMITIDGLEKLRHSNHLILDLNIMDELVKAQTLRSLYSPNRGDVKTQRRFDEINQRLIEIETLIENTLLTEQNTNDNLMQTVAPNIDQISYGTDAMQAYKDVLNFETDKEKEKESLEAYKSAVLEMGKADATSISEGITPKETFDRTFENYKNYGEEVSKVDATIKSIDKEEPKQIPEEYLKAKEKLEKLSYYNKYTNNLNKQIEDITQLTQGGR